MKKKKKFGPLECAIALVYVPLAVIWGLSKDPKYQIEPKRRRRRR
jgi:hypothetical protein